MTFSNGRKPGFALAAGMLCVSAAWSQASDTPSSGDDSNKLETVVVTSQRREQIVSKVPMSVAAVNAAALEKQSMKDLTDISRTTPGLTLSSPDPSGESNISIRGISSIVGSATTGIYIDDVPVQIGNIAGCPILCTGDPTPKIFDLDRVEILRGPQGTLYGSSSEGGAVRFITAAPKLRGELTGSVHTDVSVWQGGAPSAEAGVVLEAPIATDVAGFRLSLWDQHTGGYVDAYSPTTGDLLKTNVNSSDSQVARLAVRVTPTDRLTITPSYYYQNVNQHDRATYTESLGIDKSANNIAQPNHDRFGIAALTVDYDFDAFSLKAIVSNLNRTEDRTDDYSNFGEGREYLNQLDAPAGYPVSPLDQPLPTLKGMGTANSFTRNTQNNWTEEIRLTSTDSKSSRLSWIAGAYFQVAHQGYIENIYENVAALSSAYDSLWGLSGTPNSVYIPPGVTPFAGVDANTSYTENDHYKSTEQALYGEASYHDPAARPDRLAGTAPDPHHLVLRQHAERLVGLRPGLLHRHERRTSCHAQAGAFLPGHPGQSLLRHCERRFPRWRRQCPAVRHPVLRTGPGQSGRRPGRTAAVQVRFGVEL